MSVDWIQTAVRLVTFGHRLRKIVCAKLVTQRTRQVDLLMLIN